MKVLKELECGCKVIEYDNKESTLRICNKHIKEIAFGTKETSDIMKELYKNVRKSKIR